MLNLTFYLLNNGVTYFGKGYIFATSRLPSS